MQTMRDIALTDNPRRRPQAGRTLIHAALVASSPSAMNTNAAHFDLTLKHWNPPTIPARTVAVATRPAQ